VPPWNTCFFGPPECTAQTAASVSVQPFLHSSRQCHRACPGIFFTLKIAPSHGGSGPPSNTWFLEPTRAHNTNGVSIGSAVFLHLVKCRRACQACHSRSNANAAHTRQFRDYEKLTALSTEVISSVDW